MRPLVLLIACMLAGCGDDSGADPDAGSDVPVVPACEPGGTVCDATQWCERPVGMGCFRPGFCRPRPDSCVGEPDETVCGCDDMTYVNACEAQAVGVSVASLGACP